MSTMQIQFFLDGVVNPIIYDFELTSNGVLRPTDHHRSAHYVAILLENKGEGITISQAVAVNSLIKKNPKSEVSFLFEANSGEAACIH